MLSDQLAPIVEVAIPALFAGIVAVLATMVVERFGGALGGILSSIPTTIVPAAIGIYGRNANVDEFRRAMAFVPVGILLNAGYLVMWRVIPAYAGRRTRSHLLAWTASLALGGWLVVAGAIMLVNRALEPTVGHQLLIGCMAFASGIALGIAANRTPHHAPRGHKRVPRIVLGARGIAASIAIGCALVLARMGLPVASGLASVFPVIFTTIMVATWLSQGAHVPTGAVGPMALGTLSVSAYALLATVLFPIMNLALAAVLCWVLAVGLVSVPAYLFLAHRRRRHAQAPISAPQ